MNISILQKAKERLAAEKLEKARPHKYIKRAPKKTGKGWDYWYAEHGKGEEKKKSLLDHALQFFGLKSKDDLRNKLKADYESFGKEHAKSIGEFERHVQEYLKNRNQWQARFSGKKSGGTKGERVTRGVTSQVTRKKKLATATGPKEKKFNENLMRAIHEHYAGKKEEGKKETPTKEGAEPSATRARDWSKEKQDQVSEKLSKLPLKELRRKQDIVRAQQKSAYARMAAIDPEKGFEHGKFKTEEVQRLDGALKDMEVMDDVLAEAVNRNSFPEKEKKEKTEESNDLTKEYPLTVEGYAAIEKEIIKLGKISKGDTPEAKKAKDKFSILYGKRDEMTAQVFKSPNALLAYLKKNHPEDEWDMKNARNEWESSKKRLEASESKNTESKPQETEIDFGEEKKTETESEWKSHKRKKGDAGDYTDHLKKIDGKAIMVAIPATDSYKAFVVSEGVQVSVKDASKLSPDEIYAKAKDELEKKIEKKKGAPEAKAEKGEKKIQIVHLSGTGDYKMVKVPVHKIGEHEGVKYAIHKTKGDAGKYLDRYIATHLHSGAKMTVGYETPEEAEASVKKQITERGKETIDRLSEGFISRYGQANNPEEHEAEKGEKAKEKKEDVKISKAVIAKIADMTDKNYHGRALAYVAKKFGMADYEKQFKRINAEHEKAGHLTDELHTEREAARKKMLAEIKEKHGEKVHNQIHGAM